MRIANEILQGANAEEANRWAGTRATSKMQRVAYTDTLKHYVEGHGCMECTEAICTNLLGGRSHQLREQRGLGSASRLKGGYPPP